MIKKAPAASFILFVLALVLLYVAFQWRYSAVIESQASQISLLKDQVDDYRERLGLIPPDKTAYSKLTNQELKKSVSEFLPTLRVFAERADQARLVLFDKLAKELDAAKTPGEVAEVNQRNKTVYDVFIGAQNLEYQQKFQTKAIVLRDEMLKRLPLPPKPIVRYDLLIGATPLTEIVQDLERLASLLPEREARQ